MGISASQLLPVIYTDVGIQAATFLVSAPLQTEKLYDISGSLTYAACIGVSLLSRRLPNTSILSAFSTLHSRQKIVSICGLIWCTRLGLYLGYRVFQHGKDSRFDKVKTDPSKYWVYWAMQAVWILTTALPIYAINLLPVARHAPLGILDGLGLAIWSLGFTFETVSDIQKLLWQSRIGEERRKTEFINEGLWSLSRHPNYFGEVTLWVGNYLMCASALRHAGFVGLKSAAVMSISPIFVAALICGLSGIPILEKSSQKRFGHLKEYQDYLKTVPVFFPKFNTSTKIQKTE